MKNKAVIFAGGVGERMKHEKPKQFIKYRGKQIIIHTLNNFVCHPEIDEIFLVIKSGYEEYMKDLIKENKLTKIKVFTGGKTGMDSIYIGLREASKNAHDDDVVLIHDGVRPLIDQELISKNIKTCRKHGAAVTVSKLYETPVILDKNLRVKDVIDRNTCFVAKAPQTFFLKEVFEAHKKVRKVNPNYEGIIDNCTLMKSFGKKIKTVECHRRNIKITTRDDIYRLLGILSAEDYQEVFN
ncbi:MAG TPA: IspD/TarI family cytidylyltransferase [Candidatus Dojkabacteria bacterium]|nr:IspD/TarI family cytidylyltransferase [Candidatus Dojkabacteria bacterium]